MPVATHIAAEDAAFEAVHADTLRFFPELVGSLGGDPLRLVTEAAIPSHGLSNGLPVGYRAIATLMEDAAKSLRCADFGMRLASLQGGSCVFGALGAVMRHAPTLGAGLRYVAGHSHAHSLAARVCMRAGARPGDTLVTHEILVDGLPIKRQMIEQFLLLGHLNALEMSGGKARVREVWFRYQPLSDPRDYHRYFGAEVRFDQSLDGIVFTDSDLECESLAADPVRCAEAKAFIESTYRVRAPVRAEVRALITQLIDSTNCSKELVAAALHMHPRTLHRRLTAEGTCFEALKDAVRRDVTLGYLRGTNLSVQRIAEKVGYAEQSVLARSCSRWFDASPRAVRKRYP